MLAKDYLPIDGFEIVKDVHVKCRNCGKIHIFSKDDNMLNTWSSEGNMGTRTEYSFSFEGQCDHCGSFLSAVIRASEYPPGMSEGTPTIECKGCDEVEFNSNSIEYCDYRAYFNSPEISHIITIPHYPEVPKLELGLEDGQVILSRAEHRQFAFEHHSFAASAPQR